LHFVNHFIYDRNERTYVVVVGCVVTIVVGTSEIEVTVVLKLVVIKLVVKNVVVAVKVCKK